jgi:hypothetical protein
MNQLSPEITEPRCSVQPDLSFQIIAIALGAAYKALETKPRSTTANPEKEESISHE